MGSWTRSSGNHTRRLLNAVVEARGMLQQRSAGLPETKAAAGVVSVTALGSRSPYRSPEGKQQNGIPCPPEQRGGLLITGTRTRDKKRAEYQKRD
jgi:hypothetical protein